MNAFQSCVLFAIGLLAACAPPADETYVARDEKLLQQFEALQKKRNETRMPQAEYAAGLRMLEQQETALFQEVRRHRFHNLAAANRFYRWRLKFPSPIVEAQRRLTLSGHLY